jgi:predicted dehydrogenase
LLLWYFEPQGAPTSILATGTAPHGLSALTDNFVGLLRFPAGRHATVSQTLAGFDYHLLVEVIGTEGAVRGWWSAALDRTRSARFELRVKRRGAGAPETLPVQASGELHELDEQLRRVVSAFQERRPLVSAEEARKPVAVCLAAERSLREGREIPLD